MRTLKLNHLKASAPWKSEIGSIIVQDYESREGIVREISKKDKIPKYHLLDTKKPVRVEFDINRENWI